MEMGGSLGRSKGDDALLLLVLLIDVAQLAMAMLCCCQLEIQRDRESD